MKPLSYLPSRCRVVQEETVGLKSNGLDFKFLVVPEGINLFRSSFTEILEDGFHCLVIFSLQDLLSLVEMPSFKLPKIMMESLVGQNCTAFLWRELRKFAKNQSKVLALPPLCKGAFKSIGPSDGRPQLNSIMYSSRVGIARTDGVPV